MCQHSKFKNLKLGVRLYYTGYTHIYFTISCFKYPHAWHFLQKVTVALRRNRLCLLG